MKAAIRLALGLGALAGIFSSVFLSAFVAQGQGNEELTSELSGSLVVSTRREGYGGQLVADCTAQVGHGTELPCRVTVRCTGADSTLVTVVHTNPRFIPGWTQKTIQCGSTYMNYFAFRPAEPGLSVDNLTISSPLGSVGKQLIGNGVLAETPASWDADLGPGVSAERLVCDPQRALIYITDSGNDELIVFDASQQAVVKRISVAMDPVGLAMTPNGEKLYVANSGEHILSVIDLDAQEETDRITIPTLYPDPSEPYQYDYMPYQIAMVSDRLALLGSDPPGLASGGPVYHFDLITEELTPRGLAGRHPVFRTSYDFDAVAILVEPLSSPTKIARYDVARDLYQTATDADILRSIAVNNNGTRVVVTDGGTGFETLTVYDQWLQKQTIIPAIQSLPLAAAINPVSPKYVYVANDMTHNVDESRLDLGLQTRVLKLSLPSGYYHALHALAVSADGMWLYGLLSRVENEPPSRLLAVQVGPTEYSDRVAPISAMEPLAETQTTNWWLLSWSGTDDGSGVDYYDVQYRVGEAGTWQHLLRAAGHGVFFAGATPGNAYYFRMSATDRAGNIEPFPYDYETYTIAGPDSGGLYPTYLPIVGSD